MVYCKSRNSSKAPLQQLLVSGLAINLNKGLHVGISSQEAELTGIIYNYRYCYNTLTGVSAAIWRRHTFADQVMGLTSIRIRCTGGLATADVMV